VARFQRKHKVHPDGNHKRRGIEPLRRRLSVKALAKRALRIAKRADKRRTRK
jgi:hypothetical protein